VKRLLFLVTALLAGGTPSPASPYLRSAIQLPLSPLRWGQASALGDFDGDGRTDAVYGFSSGGGVAVLLGDGAGGFERPIVTLVPAVNSGGAVSIVPADLNGDGRLDLAVSDFGAGALVFLGLGDGRFNATALSGVIGTGGLDVGDFDGDGKQDMALGRRALSGSATEVLVYRGNGAGAFAPPVIWTVPSLLFPRGAVAADLDGDGRDDLAVADQFGDAVAVLMGSPGLAQSLRGPYPAGDGAVDVDAGDVDGDGRLDLVTACISGFATVLIGDGGGGFGAPLTLEGPAQTTFVSLADLDGDGRLDLAASGWNLWLRSGNGMGGFGAPRRYGVPFPLAVGEVNGDGRIDLLVGDSLLIGDGEGGMAAQAAFPAGDAPQYAVAADFDRDGHQDVAVANAGGSVHVLRGDGHGAFAAPSANLAGTSPAGLVGGDFDRDGWPDLAVAYAGTLDVVVLRNDRRGGFTTRSYGVGGRPIAIVTGDLDGDGVVDLLVSNETQGSLVALRGAGDGTFGPGGATVVGTLYRALAVGHFNADGRPDVATVADETGVVSVLPGTGLGTFAMASATQVPLRSRPGSLIAHDMDGDGATDLAAASDVQPDPSVSTLGVLLGAGDGTFVREDGQPPALLGDLMAADLTGDGRPDLAALDWTDTFQDALHLLEQSADRRFRSPDDGGIPIGGRGRALFVADFDEDGRLDLGAAVENANAVTLLLGRAPAGPVADLSVVIEDSPDPAPAAAPVHVRVVAANQGPSAARDVRLRFELPPVTDIVSSSPGPPVCLRSDRLVTCELPSLAAGATFELTMDIDVSVHETGAQLHPWSDVTAVSPADPDLGNNFATATTTVALVDLAVAVSDSVDPVLPGQAFRYRLEARNHGVLPATAVFVESSLPPGISLVGLPPDCLSSDGISFFCGAGTLSQGDSRAFDVDVRAGVFASASLQASVHGHQNDLDGQDNVAFEETTMSLGFPSEVTHGASWRGSLPPGSPAQQSFTVLVPPHASYEVVLDEVSGDYRSGADPVALERLASDTTTVLQGGLAPGTGGSRTLRWQNTTGDAQRQLVRVRSRGCTTDCGPDDGYRLRAYETTAALARYNTTGGQTTVVLVQNRGTGIVSGTLWFAGADGQPAGSRTFSLPPRAVFVLNVATLLPGRSGSITLTHDAGYGGLAAKAIAIEPANGTSYDTVLEYRPR
jgi:uncharacterized repeat protein (TIGR01451 family)